MTIEELLKAAEDETQKARDARKAYEDSGRQAQYVAGLYALMGLHYQGSLAYSQLAQAKMDYEWFKEPEEQEPQ